LKGTEWTLISLGGEDLLPGTHISLAFGAGEGTDQAISGFAGCNGYWGGPDGEEYVAGDDGSLEIPGIAITVELCPSPEGVMDQERAYVEAMQSAATYRLGGERLEIRDDSGETVLVFLLRQEQTMDPADLPGTAWQPVSMAGQLPIGGSTITLAFLDEHRVAGNAGRRGYVALYEADGDGLGFGYMAMLGTISPEDVLLEQEGAYTTMLEAASHYRLAEQQLEILTKRGKVLVFEPLPEEAQVALEGHTWSLQSFVEPNRVQDWPVPLPLPQEVLEGTEVTAVFEGGLVRGSGGCNTYQGQYERSGGALSFEAIAMTKMACLDREGVMEQEQRYWVVLVDVTAYWLFGGQLWLETGDGRALVFSSR
jgi:heat shock protein HslJ